MISEKLEKVVEIPHVIKYMGSKRGIIDFVINNILEFKVNNTQRFYDVFGGSATVSCALREEMPVTCNDIQSYTSVIAGIYLNNYHWDEFPEDILNQIILRAQNRVSEFKNRYSDILFNYKECVSFNDFLELERGQQGLLNYPFQEYDHLFAKNYSGTYWSYDQSIWIDAISSVARSQEYHNTFLYNVILGSLMFAMAYCSQSTGHYAQYRELTPENLDDIIFYRKKEILPLFKQKFEALKTFYNGSNNTSFNHEITTSDYLSLLRNSINNSIIYADPPYQFVHYSRFYHALETLARYDYPQVEHKGRYRNDRHQSPFCIKTKVKSAFEEMFKIVGKKNSTLILSYSDNGMIQLEELVLLAEKLLSNYLVSTRNLDYLHSTMGRQGDKSRDVMEYLIICQPI